MLNILKGFDAQAASTCINPYAVEVIRVKRRDLVYGISHTEDLLDLLVAEGVMTAAKRSVVLTITTRMDQNSRVLDHLEARGERACRIFFHPCLMLAEPDLYQRIKTYAGGVNERVRDARRQLIGYLLERDQEGLDGTEKTRSLSATKGTKTSRSPEKEDTSVPLLKSEEPKPAQSKPEHLIHMIASEGDVVLLEELLKDADINSVNSSNETLLHVAAERGHLSAIELLIRKGARLDLQDKKGHTALHRAAGRGHAETVGALVQAGAPIYALDLQGKTSVHLAADNERLSCVDVLVKAEAKPSESHDTQDMFLHTATVGADGRPAQLLLRSGAAIDARSNRELTALFDAISRNDEKTVTVLLNAGAKVEYDVIHEAVKLHDESILHLLLDNPRGALSAEALGSALFSAVKQNHDGVVTALIDRGANVNTLDQQGYTPLLLSAELGLQGHAGPVIRLLQGEADPGVRDRLGRTALHWAASSQSGRCVVDLLLSAKANPNTTDNEKKAALHLAATEGKVDAVSSLLSHRAKGGAKDMDGSTALHYAAAAGHASVVSALLHFNNKGMEERNAWRRTPLHTAAERGHDSVMVLLLEAGAKINSTDHSKDTPLHCAARGGHLEVAKALVNWGQAGNMGRQRRKKVNLQVTNNVGKTPLQVAESGDTPEHESVATFLMRKMFLIK
ncbi:CARD- and ANK-domain containing inflammasome adapter protein [Anarhichas minor]|uniref:CARD- and ANK-domain containing inflammasome adapter protein n=1 Tax=Anarhichas minor TaxID=65739 RepID=UPI003F73ED9D